VSLLEARDVRTFYGTFCALDGVSLAVDAGQFVSIIGPNGAGKTTLVNVLTGLLAPTSGSVRFKGADVAGVGPVRLARLGLARSFQLVSVFPALTVRETLAVPVLTRRRRATRLLADLRAQRDVWDEVAETAELFGLGHALGRPARTLAQGDK
jgi:branched-chain amino acid transport system ATP-binding protein